MDSNGDFFCKGTCYAHSEPLPSAQSSSTSSSSSSTSSKSPLVLFVSGLLLSSSLSLPAQLLIEFLSGQLGFLEDVKASSRISHAFFLGNSAKLPREPFQRIIQNVKEIETSSCGVSLLDELLSEVEFSVFERLTAAGASFRLHFAHSGANRRGFLARSPAAAASLASPSLCALLLAGTRHESLPRADSKPRRAGDRGAKHPGHSETDHSAVIRSGCHGVDPTMGRSVPHDAEYVPYFLREQRV